MSPGDRQKVILAFIDRYQQSQHRTPTIGDIIRNSGINAYDEVGQALGALAQRGLISYVPGTMAGAFTTRQVRLAGKAARPAAGTGGTAGPGGTAAASMSPVPAAPAPWPSSGSNVWPSSGGNASASFPPSPASARATRPSAARSAAARTARPVQQPMPHPVSLPGASWAAAGPRGWASGAADRLADAARAALRRPPVTLALAGAGVAIALIHFASQQPVGLPSKPALAVGPLLISLTALIGVAVLTLLGAAIGRAVAPNPGWSWKPVLTAAALGLSSAGLVWAWSWVEPSLAPLDRTGLPALFDGIRLLPALVPATWVPLPGAAVLGLLLAGRSLPLLGVDTHSPALGYLQLLLAVSLSEMWLLRCGPRRDRSALIVAGVLLGAGSVAATYLTVPGALLPGNWWAEAIAASLSGAAAGWAVAEVRRRLP